MRAPAIGRQSALRRPSPPNIEVRRMCEERPVFSWKALRRDRFGGAASRARHHLRQSLVFLDMPAMQQPEAYIGGVAGLLDETGKLTNEGTRDFLRKFTEAFAAWIETTARR
jgi:hypothetical protein